VAVDGAGNVYVTGISTSFVTGSDHYGNCILLKYDSSGSLLWQRTCGGINEDCGSGVAAGASGVVFVAGGTDSFGGGRELFLLKLDSSGGLLRQKTWGGSVMDSGYSVTVDGSGRVFAAGESPNAYGSWRDAGGDVSSPGPRPKALRVRPREWRWSQLAQKLLPWEWRTAAGAWPMAW
jgi:hypothetical protein